MNRPSAEGGTGTGEGVLAPGLANVLAVVVTYNPGDDLAWNLAALRDQVDQVVVIDNGSANHAAIARTAAAAGCEYLGNLQNLGIGAALSQAARLALDRGADWLAMFDQDSLAPPGGLVGLLRLFDRHPQRARIAVLAMSHRDRVTAGDYHHGRDVVEASGDWRSVRTTITSGSLVRTAVFGEVGLFDEALFIDSVDHDFCLRCRSRGYLIIEGRDQVMQHSLGAITTHELLGRRVTCGNYNAIRRYYITRNTLEVARRFAFSETGWAALSVVYLLVDSLMVLLYESQRPAKLAAMAWGLVDFLTRRFGPRSIWSQSSPTR